MFQGKNKAVVVQNGASLIYFMMLVLLPFFIIDYRGNYKTEIALLMVLAGWLWAYCLTATWMRLTGEIRWIKDGIEGFFLSR